MLLLQQLFNSFYKILNIKPDDDGYYNMIKNQFIKFFDQNKSCVVKKKKYDIIGVYSLNTAEPSKPGFSITYPDVNVLNEGLSRCENKGQKYTGDHIFFNMDILIYQDGIEQDEGHSNTIIFDKKRKYVWRVEPNFDIKNQVYKNDLYGKQDELINKGLRDFFDSAKLGYTFKGYYPNVMKTCPLHGGLCVFVSVLVMYTDKTLDKKTIKENLLKYIEWEYSNFSNNVPMDKTINQQDIKIFCIGIFKSILMSGGKLQSIKLNDTLLDIKAHYNQDSYEFIDKIESTISNFFDTNVTKIQIKSQDGLNFEYNFDKTRGGFGKTLFK